MRYTNILKKVMRFFGPLAALLLVWLIMSDAYAANVPFSRVRAVEAEVDAANWLATADMDSDGELEMLGAARNSHAMSWWTNNGDGERSSERIMDTIIYLDGSATGGNDGSSWANAYTDLQDALAAATSGNEIWVAAGTYKPTSGADRSATFQLKNGVGLYGGFDGTETARDQRHWKSYPTILSGDLSGNDNHNVAHDEPTRAENSYHVVTGSNTDSSAILDGFTITGGNANDQHPYIRGGGMFNVDGNPTISGVIFRRNSAWNSGGGMYNNNSNPTVSDVTFADNSAFYYGSGMYNNNSNPTLTDVTFVANSGGSYGGGMYNNDNSQPLISDVIFSNNKVVHDGGGMFNNNSNPTVRNVTFTGNSAHDGGGMYNKNSNPTVINGVFNNNSAPYGGGMYNIDSNPTVSNVTFSGNWAHCGAGMRNVRSDPTVSDVTFTGNFASDDGGGIANRDDSRPVLINSILWNNKDSSGTIATSQIYSGTPSVNYSLVQGGWITGTGNIDADPLFVSPINPDEAPTVAGDFHLQPTSPAIDAGDNSAVPADALDLDGDSNTTEPLPIDLDGGTRFQDHLMDDTGNGTAPIVDMGAYETGSIIYVKADATGANNGSSWTDAYTDLQDGLAAATAGNEIWVAAGTYKPTDDGNREVSFVLKNRVRLYGGFDGTETTHTQRDWEANQTIFSGDLNGNDNDNIVHDEPTRADNSIHVLWAYSIDESAKVDGFIIRSGNGNISGGASDDSGGMRNDLSRPTLSNLVFMNNTALYAAGMYNAHSSPTLINVTFNNNVAQYAGGMLNYANSDPTLFHVTFINNVATRFSGGGMYNHLSTPILNHVTFTGNSAAQRGGGMYNRQSHAIITDATFTSNVAADYGGGMSNYQSSPTVRNATFTGNSVSNDGGGMYNSESSPTLVNLTFTGNSANHGGGMHNDNSNSTVINGVFNNNSALYGGGMYNIDSNPTVSNVTFSGNSARYGAGMRNVRSDPTVSQVTFTGNFASDDGGGIANLDDSRPTLINSILWNNKDQNGTGATSQIFNGDNSTVTYSIVQGGWAGTGNINADPQFVSPIDPDEAPAVAGDFHLEPTSPAIDAGDNSAVPTDTLDLDGDSNTSELLPWDLGEQPRFRDTPVGDTGNGTAPIVDMGAYEKGLTIYVKANAAGANNGTSWTDAYTDLQAALAAATSGDDIWVAAGTYKPTNDGDRATSFRLKNGVAIYGGFGGNESSRKQRDWEANSTILSGDLSGNDNNNVAHDEPTRADNSEHVVISYANDRGTVLNGVIVAGGNASGSGGGMYNFNDSRVTVSHVVFRHNSALGDGAGMVNYSSRPTLNNVTFTENSASHSGGGMVNGNSSPTLTDVDFTGNSATNNGGGIYNYNSSTPSLTRVTFNNNSALKGGGISNVNSPLIGSHVMFNDNSASDVGGGMHNHQSNPTLSDATFVNNSARFDGAAIYNQSSNPTMRRVVFTNNSADRAGGAIFNANSQPMIASATFSGNSAGTNSGGAIFNESSDPTLSNLLITGNFAGEHGAAIYNESSNPTVSNATLSGNLALGSGGAIFNITSTLTIHNSILWDNQDSSGPDNNSNTAQIHNSNGGAANVTYSLVQGGWAGTGNINVDPLFLRPISPTEAPITAGDFHLQATSPAIDAGNNSAVLADIADLDGDHDINEPLPLDLDRQSRFKEMPVANTGSGTPPLVDMGAYEAMPPNDSVVISEIAWAGTEFSADDQWIELYNNNHNAINLSGWTLWIGQNVVITLTDSISAQGHYLMEREDDNTISNLSADLIYDGALNDAGDILILRDNTGALVDTANSNGDFWPAGNQADSEYNSALQFSTMERINPQAPDTPANWATNDTIHRTGFDANNKALNGTPRAANSITQTEADDSCVGATEIAFTNNASAPYTSLLRANRDVDFFKIDVPDEYTTIVATLTQPANFDFRLHRTCNDTIGGGDYYYLGQGSETSQEVIRFDVGGQPGTFYLRVSAPPGSYSGWPYQLQVELQPANVSNVRTLIFYNHMRFASHFGIHAASQTMGQLTELAENDNVQGTIIQLDGYPEVLAAYDEWDATPISPAMPNVQAANAVADAIREVMIENLDIDNFPRTEYIVIVGDDHQIPFGRININPRPSAGDPSWVYERQYPLNSKNSPIGAALEADQTLTDDLYGDYLIRRVYLPELSVGRLLDTPARIKSMIQTFLDHDGEITVNTAAVAGHGFLANAASAQCQSLSDAGLTCNGIINQDYTDEVLRNNFLTSTIDIVSNYWHTNHTAFQAPSPAPGGSELDAQTILDPAVDLRGQVWWSVGCQTGLVMPNDSNEEYQLSLAQALSTHGVTYVGNTGWAWASADGPVLSERLYQLLSENLTTNRNIGLGDALRKAKKDYYDQSQMKFLYYDEKVMTQATLFGLPMLRLRFPDLPNATERSIEESPKTVRKIVTVHPEAVTASDWITPTGELRFDSSLPLGFQAFTTTLETPAHNQMQTVDGEYYTSPEGQMAADAGLPILPQDEYFDFQTSLGQGHGAIWLGSNYNQQDNDPVINTVTILNSEPGDELDFNGVYPTIPITLTTTESRDPSNPFENRLLFTTGQFEGRGDDGQLRLFTDMSFLVGLSTNDDDFTPPELGELTTSYEGQSLHLSLPISDTSGIYRAVVTYTEIDNPTGSGSWRSSDLESTDDEVYMGTLTLSRPIYYFLQVMDNAGNVSTLLPERAYFTTATSHAMNMQLGWNHLAWPLAPVEATTAEEVCDQINDQGGNVAEIDRWHNGGWEGHVCGLPFNDFELATGEGYFIKSNSASSWTIEGSAINNPVPLQLETGWNTISIPHTDAYTAESLCDDIIDQGVTAIEIDRWHNAGWQGHVCGLPFNNFQIEPGTGYFIKSTSSGTVTPTQPSSRR